MNQYITGNIIKEYREKKGMTQTELAQILSVSDKAVSKWETGKGYPDITLLDPLSSALGISVPELLSGESVTNNNRGFNMKRIKFYVCPICGNIITASGSAVISCCGITLPSLEAEKCDEMHNIKMTPVEDELFVEIDHEMTKSHYISFVAFVADNRVDTVKFYPEGNAETRFKKGRAEKIYVYCNKHGLFEVPVL